MKPRQQNKERGELPLTGPGFMRRWAGPALVLATALLVRLVIYLQFREHNPLFAHPVIDAWRYDHLAREFLRQGVWPEQGAFFQPPAYPFFLALVYKIGGASYGLAKMVQVWLGACSCLFVCLTGQRLHSRQVGLIAGMFAALYGPLIFFELELLAPSLIVFWSTSGLWLLTGGLQEESRIRLAAGGLCLGIALVAWPVVGLSCAAIIPVSWWRLRKDRSRAAAAVLLLLSGITLPVVPVFLHNALHGEPAPVSTNGGINYYIGNNPDWLETIAIRPGYPWERLLTLPLRFYGPEAVEAEGSSSLFYRQAGEYIRSSPGKYLEAQVLKVYHLLSGYEIMRNTDLYYFKQYSPLLDRLFFSLPWLKFPLGLLLPLSVAGMLLSPRTMRREHVLLAAYVLGAAAGLFLFFVTARYRVILVPMLAVYGAAGLRGIVDLLSARNRILWPLLAFLLVLGFVVNGDPLKQQQHFNGPVYRAQAPFTLGRVMLEENRPAQALSWLERSVQIDPSYPDAWVDLGRAAYALGDTTRAVEAMHRAAAVAPDYPLPYFNLGLIHDQQPSQTALAVFFYRRYLAAAEGYFEVRIRGTERIRFVTERLRALSSPGQGS